MIFRLYAMRRLAPLLNGAVVSTALLGCGVDDRDRNRTNVSTDIERPAEDDFMRFRRARDSVRAFMANNRRGPLPVDPWGTKLDVSDDGVIRCAGPDRSWATFDDKIMRLNDFKWETLGEPPPTQQNLVR